MACGTCGKKFTTQNSANSKITNYGQNIANAIKNFITYQRDSYRRTGTFNNVLNGVNNSPNSGYITTLFHGPNTVYVKLDGVIEGKGPFKIYAILYKIVRSTGQQGIEVVILIDSNGTLPDIEIKDELRREPLVFKDYKSIPESNVLTEIKNL